DIAVIRPAVGTAAPILGCGRAQFDDVAHDRAQGAPPQTQASPAARPRMTRSPTTIAVAMLPYISAADRAGSPTSASASSATVQIAARNTPRRQKNRPIIPLAPATVAPPMMPASMKGCLG